MQTSARRRRRSRSCLAHGQLVRASGRRNPLTRKDPEYWVRNRELAAQALRDHPKQFARYDAVLVDEAQDLDEAGLTLLYESLRPGRDSFVMAFDAAQNIFRRRWDGIRRV